MTTISDRVLQALWDNGPLCFQDIYAQVLTTYAAAPVGRKLIHGIMTALRSSGKVGIFAEDNRNCRGGFYYYATGAKECSLTIDEAVKAVIDHYGHTHPFDQGQIAEDLHLTHTLARDTMNRMREKGYLIKVRKTDRTRALSRYVLAPKAVRN